VQRLAQSPTVHLTTKDWLETRDGAPRGYIQPHALEELWFHTGTACNLRCPFCLEGSKPGDNRLQQLAFAEVAPYLDAAVDLGVERFAFTGGEPFVNKDFVRILEHALEHRPCLVLSNGTKPLRARSAQVLPLRNRPHPLRFRISLDHPDPALHDAARGAGNFAMALDTLGWLHREGFAVSVARLAEQEEDTTAVETAYRAHFATVGLPEDTHLVVFPDFFRPGAHPDGVPEITENCMTSYQTAEDRERFMCAYSKMIVKRDGKMRIYACTLVDDDPDYDLGEDLRTALAHRIMLKHHRCFSCFARGASCSER